MKSKQRKVLLVGWDAADWKIIRPLVQAGKMPCLARLLNEGVSGNISTLNPVLSPMLWTSIATGKRPFKHGIHGFSEPDPHGGNIRPITNLSRKTKAVWNILSQNDLKSNVVGWWPSHPAEPINGVMVSNHFSKAAKPAPQDTKLAPGCVHPERLAQTLREACLNPAELDAEHLLTFIPKAAEIDQDKDRRLYSLAKTVAETASIQGAATALVQSEPWDFMAVYFDGIDHFGHGFMKYHPPKLPWISDQDFEIYQDVINTGYMMHDSMLDVLLRMAGDDVTLMLLSDHGFHPDHLRPQVITDEPAGPAEEHRQHGIFLAHGPGIRKGEQIYGTNLLDIAPTLLSLFGLPVGEDMDGKALLSIYEDPPELQSIPTWDNVEGADGSHPPETRLDARESQAALQQLVELGYIDKPSDDKELAIAQTQRELDYNLARAYMDADHHTDAADILKKLIEDWPEEFRFSSYLIKCYQALGKINEARTTLEGTVAQKQALRDGTKAELTAFKEKYDGQELSKLPITEQQRYRDLTQKTNINHYGIAYLMGTLAFAEQNYEGALEYLQQAEKADRQKPYLYISIGDTYAAMKRWDEAKRNYDKALALDDESAGAHLGMAVMFIGKKENYEAAAHAIRATQLLFHNPQAHYLLGVALHRLDNIQPSIEALETAVSQNGNYLPALERLAYIHEKRTKNTEKANYYREQMALAKQRLKDQVSGRAPLSERTPDHKVTVPMIQSLQFPSADSYPQVETRNDVITIVSGLPRSGTSMMMQMLEAGGLSALTDSVRTADEDNRKGYYELEAAKSLRTDHSWLENAKGKNVKIIAQLLPVLPPKYNYRIIFMNRDLDEVVLSQRKMLKRQRKAHTHLSDDQLKTTYQKQLFEVEHWAKNQPNVSAISIDYQMVIDQPIDIADELRFFLGDDLDEGSMVAAVDPTLYRNRNKAGHE